MCEIVRINDLDNAEFLLIEHNKEIGRELTDQELIIGIRKFLVNGDVLGIVENNHVIAMLNLYCNNYDTLQAYICNVYVLEQYRGNHLAERMMLDAITICKNRKFKSIHLHVAENNKPAVISYKKLGFEFADGKRGNDREMVLILKYE